MNIQVFLLIFTFIPFFEPDQTDRLPQSLFIKESSVISLSLDHGFSSPVTAQYWREIAQFNADELEAISEQIRLNPNDAQAYQRRGTIYASSENYQKAIEDYSESLRLEPQNAQTYNYRGTAYYWLENYSQALEDFNQALQLNSEFTVAYYNRAYVRQKLGYQQGAIEDFQQGADLSLKQGDLETYEKAVEIIRNLKNEADK